MYLVVEEVARRRSGTTITAGRAPSALECFCRVTGDGAEKPQTWSGVDVQIVFASVHKIDAHITTAGAGTIGRDDKDSLDIEVEKAPQMAVIVAVPS